MITRSVILLLTLLSLESCAHAGALFSIESLGQRAPQVDVEGGVEALLVTDRQNEEDGQYVDSDRTERDGSVGVISSVGPIFGVLLERTWLAPAKLVSRISTENASLPADPELDGVLEPS